MVRKLQDSLGVPGLAAAVWRDGAPLWTGAFGVADAENGAAVSTATRFRIGSLSKLLTAATAARLYEQGVLDLDAPVQRYVAGFPAKGAKISSRMLLGHLSGIRHYAAGEYINRRTFTSLPDTLKIFESSPLLHPPGTRYYYSSYGYNLLGAVIEGASKEDFLACVDRQVLAPLAMRSTVADKVNPIIRNRTCFYSRGKDTLLNGPYTDNSDRWPSGGFLSTVENLGRFGGAHLSDGFLQCDTLRTMFTSQRTSDGEETAVGFTWRIATINGRQVYHHGETSIGGRAFILLRPEDRVVVVLLANLTSAAFGETHAVELADTVVRLLGFNKPRSSTVLGS
jgi:serine beta-lactamase-like protein LACTB